MSSPALLIKVNHVVLVDQLLDRVWGAEPPPSASTLYSYLSRLRAILAGVSGVTISHQSGGYVLTADPATVDRHRSASCSLSPGRAPRTGTPNAALPSWSETISSCAWAGQVIPRQLPVGIVHFTGRERYLAELRAQLNEGGAVVITAIDGTAGVGKTPWPSTSDTRPPTGSRTTSRSRPPSTAPVLAGKRALVVLDNARSAAQVRPLLPASPGCLVAVTSRTTLATLDGGSATCTSTSSETESLDLLGQLAGRDRVRREPDAATTLVSLCARLPLAVRIAGARLAARPSWTITALVDRLADERRAASRSRTRPRSSGATPDTLDLVTRYIALLRGINVGGRTKVSMAELRTTCESVGCTDVVTYIQSGNVVLTSPLSATKLRAELESAIAEQLDVSTVVVIRTGRELADVVAGNPFPDADPGHLHVGFLTEPPDEKPLADLHHPPEELAVRGAHVYFLLPNGMGRAKLPVLFGRRIKIPTTVRNWRTVDKLLQMSAN